MRKVLLLLLIVALLMGGCGSHGQQSIKEVNYYQGSEGITIDFMRNSPPEKVYPGQQYAIMMNMHDEGAFSLLPYDQGGDDEDRGESLFASATLIYDPFYFSEVEEFRQVAR